MAILLKNAFGSDKSKDDPEPPKSMDQAKAQLAAMFGKK